MVGFVPRLPRSAWKAILLWALGTALAITLISMSVAICVLLSVYGTVGAPEVLTAAALPMVLTPPVVGFFLSRHYQLKLANEKLQELAFKDSLVGCMNRRGFTSSVDIALQYATPHRPCALLIVDADNFKQVNDKYGHDQGDEALLLIAQAIKSAIRSADLLGRIGGEEFGIFLPGASHEQANVIAERVCDAVAAVPFAPAGQRHGLSVSIGGAIATEPTSFADIFKNADRRLYVAKRSGRAKAELTVLRPGAASTAA